MAVNVSTPFSWEAATGDMAAMLDELQPNIIKAHTREFLKILFLKFDQASAGKTFLKALVSPPSGTALMKSAKTHLLEVKAFNAAKKAGKSSPPLGTAYVGVGLTATGYTALGIPTPKQPDDSSFKGGMKNAALADPAPAKWEKHFRGDIHAIILVGDATRQPRDIALAAVRSLIASTKGVVVLGEETGHGQHNKNGEGIEHFGYVDGRSQPIFLKEDIDEEKLRQDGATTWDPAFAPSRAIIPDPASPIPAKQFGSYFVFRKLEQNVKLFKKEEKKLAERLKLKGADEERAGAMIVGRFEDGTPVTSQFADGSHNPVPNNFNYDSDPEGGKCPFFGHIRKMNPRGSGGFENVDGERKHIMARRGQTYGVRTDDLNDGKLANKPTSDVGLLFMAFNAVIAEQFEFAQKSWANNPGFPRVPPGGPTPGLDLVIGQGARPDITCPLSWGADLHDASANKETSAPPQAVTMKGGEYFFMPSLAFLRSL
jgi:Dyp-type peroxidase family